MRGVRVGATWTEKMNKGKIMRRRAATLRKHLNSEIRKKEIDDEMKRSKNWEGSQGCGPGRQGWRDIQEEMGVVVTGGCSQILWGKDQNQCLPLPFISENSKEELKGWGLAEMERVGRESHSNRGMSGEELTSAKERSGFALAPGRQPLNTWHFPSERND